MYFTNLQNSYFKDIKNLKLNGATILDLSKKQKTRIPNSCCKKINDGLLQIYLFMYDICPTHKQKKKEHEEKILKLLGKRYGVYFSKLSNATFAW